MHLENPIKCPVMIYYYEYMFSSPVHINEFRKPNWTLSLPVYKKKKSRPQRENGILSAFG